MRDNKRVHETIAALHVLVASPNADELNELALVCKQELAGAELTISADTAVLARALRDGVYSLVVASAGLARGIVSSLPGGQEASPHSLVLLLSDEEGGEEAARIARGLGGRLLVVPEPSARRRLVSAYLAGFASLLERDGKGADYEHRYENLVQALPDIVYELDPQGVITFLNSSIELLGYKPAELIGKHFSILLHEEDAKAVDRDKVLSDYLGQHTGLALSPKLFNERRSIDRRTSELEVRLKKKHHTGFASSDLIGEVISYGEVSAAGEYDVSGVRDFKGSVGIIRDVTLRRKSEEMLRKLYQAVDQLASCVFVVNHAFETEYVNPAFFLLTGFSPAEVIGRSIFRFFAFPPEKAEGMRKHVQDGFDLREEVIVPKARGGQFWVDFALSPVRSPNGIVTHAIAIVDDVSARKGMEELLKAARREADNANQAKTRFLASMTHELKNPITGIMTAAKLIQMVPEEGPKRASSILEYAQSLQDILGGILDYVRSEGGDSVIHRLSFPLSAFMETTCAPYRRNAAAKGLDFKLQLQGDDTIDSDPDRLGRAIGILIDNAVKFTNAGAVVISAQVERMEGNVPHLRVLVNDTGLGIESEDKDRIFQPFTRVGEIRGVESRGAGIGLALARNLVRVLGGEIRMDSHPGSGSSFTLIVPSGVPASIEHSSTGSPYVLLLVDDNEVNLEYMRTLIENSGYKVQTAASAAEAFKVLEAHYVDAAILDIQMPGYNGFELGKAIRAYAGNRYAPSMPLFAMTAHDPGELVEPSRVFREVFAKPADIRGLLVSVRDALAERETVSTLYFNANFAGRKNERIAAIAVLRESAMEALSRIRLALSEEASRIDVRGEAGKLSSVFQRFGHPAALELVKLFIEYYAIEEPGLLLGMVDRIEGMALRALAGAEREGIL